MGDKRHIKNTTRMGRPRVRLVMLTVDVRQRAHARYGSLRKCADVVVAAYPVFGRSTVLAALSGAPCARALAKCILLTLKHPLLSSDTAPSK